MAVKTPSVSIHTAGPTVFLENGGISVVRDNPGDTNVKISVYGTVTFLYASADAQYNFNRLYLEASTGGEIPFNKVSEMKHNGDYISSDEFQTTWTSGTLTLYSDCRHDDGGCHSAGEHTVHKEIATFDISEVPYNPYSPPSISLNSHKDLGVYNKTDDYWVKYTITAGTKSILYAGLEVYDSSCTNKLHTYTDISKTTGSEQTYTYKLSTSNCDNGGHYKIKLYVQDGTSTEYSGWKDIHTCHEPSISDLNLWTDGSNSATKKTKFSPQNTGMEFWWTQSGITKWTDQGEVDQTNDLYTYTNSTKHSLPHRNGSGISPDPDSTNQYYVRDYERYVRLNTVNINTLFPTNERDTAALTKRVYVSRTQPQIGIDGRTTKTAYVDITLQLQPNNSFDGFKICNSSGTDITSTIQNQLVNKNDYSSVILKWSYDTTAIASGVVSGYKVGLYSNAACTDLIKDLGSVDTNQYTLNVKDNCRSLILNYVKITPYYKYNNNIYEGTSPLKKALFTPYGIIKKPVIKYPVNETIWHNRNFRVLFTLPEDEDYDSSQADTYRYADINIYITGVSSLISQPYDYKFSEYPFMFSSSTLSHQKAMVVNPSLTTESGNLSLGGLGNFQKYKIKIKVAKTILNKTVWSEWSDEITVNRSELTPLEAGGEDYLAIYQELNEILNESDSYSGTGDTNINIYNELNTILEESDPYSGGGQGDITVGGIIRASHYNTIRDYSERLRSVYNPLATEDTTNTQVQIEDIIDHTKYLKIYNTIKRIQTSVNNYATFDEDRQDVKFNQTISLLDEPDDQPIRDEIITAERDLRPGSGRDYLLLLYDSMSLLY